MIRYSVQFVLSAALASALVAGCAASPTNTASTAPDDQIQVTGSRLPAKDRSSSASVKSMSNQNDVGDTMQRNNPNNMKGGTGL